MIIRSKAPLRLGLAGGGTDVSPYSDLYGGVILNATVNMNAYATIEPMDNGKIVLSSVELDKEIEMDAVPELETSDEMILAKGVYNRIVRDFSSKPLSFKLTTYVDAPPGSGLGSSSTLTVAILGAFVEWLNLPLGEYDIAHLAYEIERIDLEMAGGKQDQYAATFGGFNFMEFHAEDKVIVNPLRIKSKNLNELENNLLLYYTDTSRLSSEIIIAQSENVVKKERSSIDAMDSLKEQAIFMKEALLKGSIDGIGEILDQSWKHKKLMASGISNPMIDEIYEVAFKAGASGGKISGAGGGGFMILYCPMNTKYKVIASLKKFKGSFQDYCFTKNGMTSWKM